MKRITLISILILLVATSSIAGDKMRDGWVERNGKPLPDTNFRKAEQGFGAILSITDDPNFFKSWNTPSKTFEYTTLKTIKKEKYFIISLIFINPGSDKNNYTNIIYDVKISKPDGTIYADVPNLIGWNREAPPQNILGLSEGYLTVKMEPEDPYGTYSVEMKVQDIIKKVTLNLHQEYEVIQ